MRVAPFRLDSRTSIVGMGERCFTTEEARALAADLLRVADDVDAVNARDQSERTPQLRLECDAQRELAV